MLFEKADTDAQAYCQCGEYREPGIDLVRTSPMLRSSLISRLPAMNRSTVQSSSSINRRRRPTVCRTHSTEWGCFVIFVIGNGTLSSAQCSVLLRFSGRISLVEDEDTSISRGQRLCLEGDFWAPVVVEYMDKNRR